MRHFLYFCAAILITACGNSGNGLSGDQSYEDRDQAVDAAIAATENARQVVYEERGADSDGTGADVVNVDAYSVADDGNYECTEDCSGHEAGFEWAQENDIGDSSDCGGNSQSFIEGCEAFVEERQEEADRETQEEAEAAAEEVEENVEYDSDDY